MFVKRLRAILIDRALYKYCIIIIIIIIIIIMQSQYAYVTIKKMRKRPASHFAFASNVGKVCKYVNYTILQHDIS